MNPDHPSALPDLGSGAQTLEPWVQIDLDTGQRQGTVLLDSGFLHAIAEWRRAGVLQRFFFVHKPPGVRLRFLGASPDLSGLLRQWFNVALPGSWRFGCYEPERYQFGGTVGLDITHEFFTVESIAVLAYRDCLQRGRARIGPYEFSILLLDRCFREVVSDDWELWDLWCHHCLTGRLCQQDLQLDAQDLAGLRDLRAEVLPLLRVPGVRAGKFSTAEERLWSDYESSVDTPAARMRCAAANGELLWGARQILPFWAVFHWNRMAFDFAQQRGLARLMVRVLHPKW